MIVTTDNTGTATLELEEYADLLKVRCLPDYRFLGDRSVTCDVADLEMLGLARAVERHHVDTAPHLFDFQEWVTRRAVERERFAIFADTGLGKTAMQLDWARLVTRKHHGRTLIVAPLSVCHQTIAEAERFYPDGSVVVHDLTTRARLDRWLTDDPKGGTIGITNYEKLDGGGGELTDEEVTFGASLRFANGDALDVQAVVLDESSMLKSFGVRKFAVMRAFDGCRYKLACSATPAPNQRTEFAQHALFLGYVRSTTEYLTAYFVNRDGEWEFKPHAFDAWIANLSSWGVFIRDPKRWGFVDHLSAMQELTELFPDVPLTSAQMEAARRFEVGEQPSLFGATPGGVMSRTKMMQIAHGFLLGEGRIVERYPTLKPEWVARSVNHDHAGEQVIVWVTFDEEGDQLAGLIPESMHLSGKTKQSVRDAVIDGFRAADPSAPRVLILKPSMFGFGINLQSCAVQVFSTITDSFERYYQCVRRSHRYGQTRPVTVYVPLTQLDQAICQNVMNKQSTFQADAEALEQAVVDKLRPADTSEVRIMNPTPDVEIARHETEAFTLIHADAVAHIPTMAPESVDLSVFSPPFAALYAYSKALGDMGNVRADAEFRLQWRWFADGLLRVMKPGRVVAIHCKEIIRFANTHGYRHCYDFPSDLRDGMVDAGFRYQRRVTIWKNPQLEATRNKETSLLHITALRDAAQSFPQTGEYLMIFTAPGDNPEAIQHRREHWTFEHHTAVMNSIWPAEGSDMDDVLLDQWLDPNNDGGAWHGIRETDVLTAATAKDHPEEKHVCPLQLGLIDRCVDLWSLPGELVFSPFAGIGSEGWSAIALGRRYYGIELKDSYYRMALKNLKRREREVWQRMSLFDGAAS